jgi:hypothetical protein
MYHAVASSQLWPDFGAEFQCEHRHSAVGFDWNTKFHSNDFRKTNIAGQYPIGLGRNMETKLPTKSSEVLEAAIKRAVSAIPVVGGLIAELGSCLVSR